MQKGDERRQGEGAPKTRGDKNRRAPVLTSQTLEMPWNTINWEINSRVLPSRDYCESSDVEVHGAEVDGVNRGGGGGGGRSDSELPTDPQTTANLLLGSVQYHSQAIAGCFMAHGGAL